MKKLYITVEPEQYMDFENIHGNNIYKLENVYDASCDEIIARNIIDTVPSKDVASLVLLYISKVHRKGKITISGNDLDAISKSYTNKLITVAQVSELLFGNNKLSVSSVFFISEILEDNNFTIINIKRDNYLWSITAERQ